MNPTCQLFFDHDDDDDAEKSVLSSLKFFGYACVLCTQAHVPHTVVDGEPLVVQQEHSNDRYVAVQEGRVRQLSPLPCLAAYAAWQ